MKLTKFGEGAEIFLSVQGEGRSLGILSVFVRSSMCNLHCVWCDTDYTWNWKGTPFVHLRDADPCYKKYEKSDQIISMATPQIADVVEGYGARNVVLTGGEPLLQQDGFSHLMETLIERDPGYTFEVETNATLVPSDKFNGMISQYNVSPKLPSSGNSKRIRIKTDALHFYATSNKSWFKFVCCDLNDLNEVEIFVSEYNIRRDRTFIMPQGTDSDHIRDISRELIGPCIEKGFNFTDRLHVHLFRNKRGT